jgi:Tol biopolymer transport system component
VAYAAPGYLFFVRENTLTLQPFNAGRLQLSGEARPAAERVAPFGESGPTGYAPFAVSDAGVLAYRAGADPKTQLAWFDRSGKQLGAAGPAGVYDDPWLSPDEKRVAIRRNDPQTGSDNIWLMDLASGSLTRFTFHSALDTAPVWSPDGTRIVFASNSKGQMDLYQRVSTGGGNDEVFLESKAHTLPDDWSQDGRYLILERADPKTKLDLWALPLFGERKPTLFLQTQFNETHARFSPDGRWLAYVSDESGRAEVYVQPFPSSAGKWQVSANGGDQPAWRRDGKELFYLAADKKLMGVEVKAGSSFETGAQRALFQTRVRDNTLTGDRNQYAVASNGQRFLVVTFVSESSAAPITVVLNWHSDFKR